MHDQLQDISWVKVISGLAGAFVSLRFINGTWIEKLIMSLGGVAMSYFGTPVAASYIGMVNAEGLVGFLIGLFGMSVVSKLYEVIQAVEPKAVLNRFLPSEKKD